MCSSNLSRSIGSLRGISGFDRAPRHLTARAPGFDRQIAFARVGTALALTTMAAVSIGALSLGALAVGALAIGRLSLGKGRIKKLRIDELEVGAFKGPLPESAKADGNGQSQNAAARAP